MGGSQTSEKPHGVLHRRPRRRIQGVVRVQPQTLQTQQVSAQGKMTKQRNQVMGHSCFPITSLPFYQQMFSHGYSDFDSY